MLKVVLVDDEPLIRKMLTKIISEDTVGFEVCGEAESGEAGITLIEKLRPDIVITDICMSNMSGLEMIDKVSNLIPWGKIIVLTGYRDFEYAKQAVSLGVFRFLVKPTKKDELLEALSEAAKQINKEAEEPVNISFVNILDKNLIIRQRRLFGIMSEMEEIYAAERPIEYSLPADQKYLMILISGKNNDSIDGFSSVERAVEHINEKLGTENIIIYVDCETVVMIAQKTDMERDTFETANDVAKEISECQADDVYIGISGIGMGEAQLAERYCECKRALIFAEKTDTDIVCFSDIEDKVVKNDAIYRMVSVKDCLIASVINDDKERMLIYLKLLGTIVSEMSDENMDYIKRIYSRIMIVLAAKRVVLKKKEEFDIRLEGIKRNIYMCDDKTTLNKMLSLTIESEDSMDKLNISRKVRMIVEYINEKYAENITLDDVAKHIRVSSYHASRAFKKEIGKNLIDYINELRINKAMEIMHERDYRIYEVAERVGISNTHYFARLFKKFTGITPSEYMQSIVDNN